MGSVKMVEVDKGNDLFTSLFIVVRSKKKTTVNIISSEQLIEKVGTIPRQPYVFETGIQVYN